jgi:hypothetical protein
MMFPISFHIRRLLRCAVVHRKYKRRTPRVYQEATGIHWYCSKCCKMVMLFPDIGNWSFQMSRQ